MIKVKGRRRIRLTVFSIGKLRARTIWSMIFKLRGMKLCKKVTMMRGKMTGRKSKTRCSRMYLAMSRKTFKRLLINGKKSKLSMKSSCLTDATLGSLTCLISQTYQVSFYPTCLK